MTEKEELSDEQWIEFIKKLEMRNMIKNWLNFTQKEIISIKV
jgi:hypothetical protein